MRGRNSPVAPAISDNVGQTVVILFDLDDTLLNHTAAFAAGAEALYRRVSPALSLPASTAAWNASLRRQFDRYLAGEISYERQRLERVREVVDPSLTDEVAEEVFGTYFDAYESAWTLFSEVPDVLEQLSGYRLGVVTNGQVEQQRRKLERTGVLERFDCVVVSGDRGVAKPEAKIFWEACSILREEPGRSLYVGDHYDLDAVGGRRAGLHGVWLDRERTVGPDHLPPMIHSLRELPDLVTAIRD